MRLEINDNRHNGREGIDNVLITKGTEAVVGLMSEWDREVGSPDG